MKMKSKGVGGGGGGAVQHPPVKLGKWAGGVNAARKESKSKSHAGGPTEDTPGMKKVK